MRLVMMGTGGFAEPTFEAILAGPDDVVGLVTQPDRATGRKGASTRQTGRGMTTIAQEHGVPVFQPESINTPEGVAQLQAFAPDLFVVAAYGQILSRDVLTVPPLGAINVHGSLLPKYRGAAPIAWAIYHGETEAGVTIIRITPDLDAGEMLAKGSVTILPDETAGELEARLAPIGARLTQEALDRMRAGPVSGEVQDPTLVTRAPKLKKTHGLIDFTKPSEQVCRQIRAMQPFPSAYTFWHRVGSDKPPLRLQILKAHPLAETVTASPGEAVTDGALIVAAGEGAVEILELQPAGKKAMPAAEFLRGQPIRAGDVFGPESRS